MKEIISSTGNSRIKNIVRLITKAKARKEQNLVIIEGAREWHIAAECGYHPQEAFVCGKLFTHSNYPEVLQKIPNELITEVTPEVFGKMAYRENSDGLIVVCKQKTHTLHGLKLPPNPFLIVLEAVEKPGNLGAILRTADAAGVDAIIVCDPLADIYNPNVIRSSVGCVFSVPTAVCTSEQACIWLKENHITTFAAELQAQNHYQKADFTIPSAIVMGTEANGLTPFWLSQANQKIKIPMKGKIDSLNVSVATAILTFEAMRQRGM